MDLSFPAQWYRQIQDAYMDEIQTAYTTVPPSDGAPRLQSWFRQIR